MKGFRNVAAYGAAAMSSLLVAVSAFGQGSPGDVRWGVRQHLATDAVAERMLARGYELIYAREYDTARACYEFVLTLYPDCAEAHTGLGFAHRYLGNDQQALDASRQALALDSLAFAANWNYGELVWPWRSTESLDSMSREERIALSIRHLEKAAASGHAASAHAFISLWTAYMGTCDIARARAQLHELKLRQYFPQILLDYAHNVLVGLDQGAILVTGGDMDTYPLFYLQAVEGFRRDVRIVNSSLARDRTMLKCLRDSLGISLPATVLVDPADAIDPQVVVSAIIQSAWNQRQPVYLAATAGKDLELPRECGAVLEGLTIKLERSSPDGRIDVNKIVSNMRKYRLDFPAQPEDWKQNLSPITRLSHVQMLANYLPLYAVMAEDYVEREDKSNAVACYRKLAHLCTLIGNEQGLVSAARAWWQIEPGSREVSELLKRQVGNVAGR